MLTTNDIRNSFKKYFSDRNHEIVESSPLVPRNDNTLLFANAGMNQFKDYFTGTIVPNNKRAVSVQKCVRAGGKHNDLENVGFTARHHTFFEMLGNFSFGDYFKREAIEFAWEYLTEVVKLNPDRLLITVHEKDQEAREIWNKKIGLSNDKIFNRGDKDNFWEMGEVGPCGPSSEIFYDHGEKYTTKGFKKSPEGDLLDDGGRHVEIWNLVFMQYERSAKGLADLPSPSIDTGSGLERLAASLQGVYFNYDIDSFQLIIENICQLSGKKYGDPNFTNSIRVVADHIRASSMLITDGVIPSNEGRGYVLRRIIRRAVRHLKNLGLNEPAFYQLTQSVFKTLGHEYPENQANQALAEKLLKNEEEKFLDTLDQGLKFLNTHIENSLVNKSLPGNLAFKLYDTFGFPLDLTEIILHEKGLSVDQEGFEKSMEEQKEKSRKSWKGGSSSVDQSLFQEAKEKHGETEFCGYLCTESDSVLIDIIDQGDNSWAIFNKTPFYGESGGQIGDQGTISLDGKVFAKILDTQKPVDHLYAHLIDDKNKLEKGNTYQLRVNSPRRELIKRNHSATHLLQSALIKVLGDHIKQAGSLVTEEKLRFDFTHPEQVTEEQLNKVEFLVNQAINEDLMVSEKITTKEEAIKDGAMALFGEKYGNEVRVIKMDAFSTELCGGTHVDKTSEIGLFTLLGESSLSSGVRRIEATTSLNAINLLKERSLALKEIEKITSVKFNEAPKRIKQYQKELKQSSKTIQNLEDKIQMLESKSLFDSPENLANGIDFISVNVKGDLRKISDQFISKYPKGICLLYSILSENKVSILLRKGKEVSKEINCSNIIKGLFHIIDGRGGGKPDMAQGSGTNSNKIQSFVESLKDLIQKESM